LRRASAGRSHAQSQIVIGDMTIDLDAKILHVNGVRIHLTGRHVIETVWGGGYVLREADQPVASAA
jgi:DNA-binding response OmpR family regulator